VAGSAALARTRDAYVLDLTTGQAAGPPLILPALLVSAIQPDGQTVVTATSDQTLRVWDVSGKERNAPLRRPPPPARWPFSPDGRLFVYAVESTLHTWDAIHWKPIGNRCGWQAPSGVCSSRRTRARLHIQRGLSDGQMWERGRGEKPWRCSTAASLSPAAPTAG
jgi:WD40 repeat protein